MEELEETRGPPLMEVVNVVIDLQTCINMVWPLTSDISLISLEKKYI